jgi:8-oxo-dGTP diphosphatase
MGATPAMGKTGASIIFLNDTRQVLLLLRDNNETIPFPNCWDLPGGHVEASETPFECIQREIREELEMELEHPRLFRVYDLADRREYTFWQNADFDVTLVNLREGQRMQWFSEDDIGILTCRQIAFDFKPILLDFYQGRPWLNV